MAAVTDTYTLEQAEEDIATLRGQITVLNEIHTIANGPTPVATAGAAQLYATGGQPAYLNPQGIGGNLSAGNAANTGGITVTAASLTDIATYVIPGGDSQAGSVYRLTALGHVTAGSTQASNSIQWNISHGGVGGGSQTTGTSFLNINQGARFHAQVYLVCVSPGSSGSFWMSGMVCFAETGSNILPGSAGQQAAGFAMGTVATITVNSTVQETIRLQVAWGAVTGAPTLTCDAFFTERIA